jgi:hypothetical protein
MMVDRSEVIESNLARHSGTVKLEAARNGTRHPGTLAPFGAAYGTVLMAPSSKWHLWCLPWHPAAASHLAFSATMLTQLVWDLSQLAWSLPSAGLPHLLVELRMQSQSLSIWKELVKAL